MRCFEHIENESIAVCAGCNKGVCQKCFTVIKNKSCCGADTCKEDIEILYAIISRNEEAVGVSNNILKNGGLFNGILGIIFIITGLYTANTYKSFDEVSIFSITFGMVFLIYGIFSSRRKMLYKE